MTFLCIFYISEIFKLTFLIFNFCGYCNSIQTIEDCVYIYNLHIVTKEISKHTCEYY